MTSKQSKLQAMIMPLRVDFINHFETHIIEILQFLPMSLGCQTEACKISNHVMRIKDI
jgi:hypothetical protein